MKEQSRKIALCGVLCALAVVILLLGGLLAIVLFMVLPTFLTGLLGRVV